MSLKRLLEEEAEMEKEMFGKTTDNQADEASVESVIPNIDTFDLDDNSQDQEVITDTKEDVQESKETESEKKQRASWKLRFKNYKASTDKTISNLRKENSELYSRVASCTTKIDELSLVIAELKGQRKDVYSELITQEDIDMIGPEAIDIIKKTNKKATEAALSPLKEEIAKLKMKELESIKRASEERRKAEYGRFTADLGRLVPDYQALNIDSGFEKYMMDTDEATGERRLDVFRRAEDYLDAERVADFFNDYKASMPRSKKEMLEDKLTPNSNSSSSAPINSKRDTFTIKEVDKFFDDVNKGLYKNKRKEADEIEAKITRAYIDGNITY